MSKSENIIIQLTILIHITNNLILILPKFILTTHIIKA